MPLLVERGRDGGFTVTFVVCQGEALTAAGVEARDGDARQGFGQGAPHDRYDRDTELTMTVTDATLGAGELLPGVPVILGWKSAPPSVAQLDIASISSTDQIARFNPADLGSGEGTWLVANPKDDILNVIVTPTDRATGLAEIARPCEER